MRSRKWDSRYEPTAEGAIGHKSTCAKHEIPFVDVAVTLSESLPVLHTLWVQ
jgi:hypothetical protein